MKPNLCVFAFLVKSSFQIGKCQTATKLLTVLLMAATGQDQASLATLLCEYTGAHFRGR